jgi:hypothetical protein
VDAFPERYIAYEQNWFKHQKEEVGHQGPLPQPIGDQFGWPQLVRDVADIYRSLPPAERENRGFSPATTVKRVRSISGGPNSLPRAYSRHQNHWYWGPPPQDCPNLILLQYGIENVQKRCTSFPGIPSQRPVGMGEKTGSSICAEDSRSAKNLGELPSLELRSGRVP